MPLGDQGVAHLGRRQVGISPLGLELRIGIGVGFYDGADVGGELRILVLAAAATAHREIVDTPHPLSRLVESLGDRVTTPAETTFGLAGVAVAEFPGDLGDEGAAAESGQSSGPRSNQGVERFRGGVHPNDPPW